MGGSRKPYTVEEERSARGAASIGHAVIGRERVSVAIVALAMATTGTAAAVGRMLQTGAGVARREAYHAVRADERSVLEEVDAEAALRTEAAAQKL